MSFFSILSDVMILNEMAVGDSKLGVCLFVCKIFVFVFICRATPNSDIINLHYDEGHFTEGKKVNWCYEPSQRHRVISG